MTVKVAEERDACSRVEHALAECIEGAQVAAQKADTYLRLAQGEADDKIYEACRSMSRFYASMSEFFIEEQRAIGALLRSPRDPASPFPGSDIPPARHAA